MSLDRTYGYVSNQKTADFLNTTLERSYEVNKIYTYVEWTQPDDALSKVIKDYKTYYDKYVNTFANKQIYERNGNVFIDGIHLLGEKYDSNKLPDDFGPTFPPVGPDDSSHIIINTLVLLMVIFLLF